eukprot:TRINITY_DN25368_c0_g1_i1.p3 TRINITY_DN25368_c0_g1~~TRINITY_DN25368_c0_g1_i1.p3  ORF type:complete len:123 (+),score=11.64 TRINITY_DN25368_c0_g1_i1:35-403(+)
MFFFKDRAPTEIYTLHIVGSVRCVQETGVHGGVPQGNGMPCRFKYPASLQRTNLINYQAAKTSMGGDDFNVKLIWQKQTPFSLEFSKAVQPKLNNSVIRLQYFVHLTEIQNHSLCIRKEDIC